MAKNAISSMSSQPDLQPHQQTVAEATTVLAAGTITIRKKSRSDHRDSYRQTIHNNTKYGKRTAPHSCAHHNFPV
jgi:hypothetical protein